MLSKFWIKQTHPEADIIITYFYFDKSTFLPYKSKWFRTAHACIQDIISLVSIKINCRGGGILQTAVNPPTDILTTLESAEQSYIKAILLSQKEKKN